HDDRQQALATRLISSLVGGFSPRPAAARVLVEASSDRRPLPGITRLMPIVAQGGSGRRSPGGCAPAPGVVLGTKGVKRHAITFHECTVEWSRILSIESVPFHPTLIDLCAAAVQEVAGSAHRLPAGALHDATEVARAGIPTVMMFVQSVGGISHNKI